MSTVVWKLEYDGEIRPLAQWGLVNAKLDLVNQQLDTLTITVARRDDADPEFEFEKKVVLWRDDVRWFHGWITRLPFAERADGMRQEYVASGPWYWLDKTIYQQPRWVLADPNAPAIGWSRLPNTRLVLFRSSSGSRSNSGAQAEATVDYAIAKATAYNGGTATFSRGSYSDVVAEAPWERGRDLSCAEVFRRCMRWTRDAVAYWDHSGEIPQLNVKRRANLTPAELDIEDADRIAEYSLTPRPDLQPRGVSITFEVAQMEVNGEGEQTGAQWTKLVEQTAGTADGGPRCISATLPLSGAGDGAEPIPTDLAQDYFDSISALQWEGSVRLLEAYPTGVMLVGNVLNLLGGRTAWETMAAVVQRVSIDIVTGETVVDFGPAEQLGPQDFLDQVRFQRSESAGNDARRRFEGRPEPQEPGNNPPTPPSGPPGEPGGPPTRERTLTLCGPNGEEEEFVVRGYKRDLTGDE